LALGPVPLQLVYHPEAVVRFLWCALPNPYQASVKPVPETLTAGFVRPFATRASAQADEAPASPPTSGPPQGIPLPGPIAAGVVPIHSDTWSGADASASLTLPATLSPCYYLVFMQDAIYRTARDLNERSRRGPR
jgi:hypothetical protein